MKNTYGEMIRELRLERKLVQKELIGEFGSQSYLSKIESGYIDPPATVLYHISLKLGVDMNTFFETEKVEKD